MQHGHGEAHGFGDGGHGGTLTQGFREKNPPGKTRTTKSQRRQENKAL